jgi:hypothetical protein
LYICAAYALITYKALHVKIKRSTGINGYKWDDSSSAYGQKRGIDESSFSSEWIYVCW